MSVRLTVRATRGCVQEQKKNDAANTDFVVHLSATCKLKDVSSQWPRWLWNTHFIYCCHICHGFQMAFLTISSRLNVSSLHLRLQKKQKPQCLK